MLLQAETIFGIAWSLLLFIVGVRVGLIVLRQGGTANDLFRGKAPLSLLFLGLYVFAMALVLHVPQWRALPMEWRISGLQTTWMMMRSLLLGVCGAAITISWHTARTQVFAIVVIGWAGVMAFTGMESYLLTPIHPSLHVDVRPFDIVKQTSSSSCAPAALATLLNRWQIDATEPELARLAGTSRMGTSMPQLIVAAQHFGMDGIELNPSWETMQHINRPGILSIWLMTGARRLPHAVTLLKMSDDAAVIADPAQGKAFIVDRQELERVWRREYVPIFRPSEVRLLPAEAQSYLADLGYYPGDVARTGSGWRRLFRTKAPSPLEQAIKQFQADHPGLTPSGTIDAATALALTGHISLDRPTLEMVTGSSKQVHDYHHQDV